MSADNWWTMIFHTGERLWDMTDKDGRYYRQSVFFADLFRPFVIMWGAALAFLGLA
jgi:hypothetical protein